MNWLVVLVYLAVTIVLGQRFGGRQRDVDDYFLAGRRTPWWAASLSIVGTETSTLTFVGVPALAYGGDLRFLQVAVGYVVGRVVVALLLVPAYFRRRLRTAYQVLAERFGGRVRTLASVVFLVSRCLADGVRLFATALVLQALLPMPLMAAILLVAGCTLVYTLTGGLRAVIWNDVVQLGVYLSGAGVAAWILLGEIPGGWQGAAEILRPAGKLRWLDLSWDLTDPYTFWAGVIGGAVLTCATHGTDQMFVQRLLACPDRRSGQAAVVTSGLVVLAQMALFLWIGSLLWTYYSIHPPEQPFPSHDAVFPHFIARSLPAGVAGLVIAALFAAAMSTLSSSLSSLASISTLDLWAAGREPGDDPDLGVSRWMTAGWAVVLAAVALLARSVDSVLEAGLTITSVTFGGVLGVFLLGQTGWRLGQGRAAAALAAGVGTLTLVAVAPALSGWLGTSIPGLDLELAWTWYTAVGAAVTFATGAALARR